MNYKMFFLSFFVFGNLAIVQAQGILAAQLEKRAYAQDVSAKIEIYRKGVGGISDKILFNWGDGVVEEFGPPGAIHYFPQFDYTRVTYFGTHNYENSGLYELSFEDGFLVEGVKNIENSGSAILSFKDTLNVIGENQGQANNEAPLFFNSPDSGDIILGESGEIWFPATYNSEIFSPAEDFKETVIPFPAEGYSYPPGDLYMDDNVLVWDKPIEPGIYGFCIKVREFRRAFGNPDDSVFMSTAHFAFMIEIDSNMLVSSLDIAPLKAIMSLFPNPANSTLNIQLQHNQSTQGKLQIENLSGQTLHTEALNLNPALQSWQVDVADWPSGVYVVRLQAGAEQVVRKFVVE
jgi:hypothetical protein